MRVHFIAMGGSVMHNLAIALHKKGYKVTGSDDEFFDPSKSRLKKYGLLPANDGWDANRISKGIDAIILGMHARENNPELKKAQALNLKIYSFPEFLYEQTRNKKRVVVGGSHGKTTITSMVMHVLQYLHIQFDYMVGAQIKGFETMVHLSEDAEIAVFEGDEYLSSPIDRRPKFHLYKPHVALISGIAWDHINVFPTFDNYKLQFEKFIEVVEDDGVLIFNSEDKVAKEIALKSNVEKKKAYATLPYMLENNQLYLDNKGERYGIQLIGKHNLQNIAAAKAICMELNISEHQFYAAIQQFEGAAKRLQLMAENEHSKVYFDFAHAPSKLKATIEAVKFQYPQKHVHAIMELHTFSSLNKSFLGEYKNAMKSADEAWVYFNPKTIAHKQLESLGKDEIRKAFNHEKLVVFDKIDDLKKSLLTSKMNDTIVLIMTSGNLSGIDINHISQQLVQ